MTARSPIPVRVVRHPHYPERFTHLVTQSDALGRGWLTNGAMALGVWFSRQAAWTAARRLEKRGVVVIVGRAA